MQIRKKINIVRQIKNNLVAIVSLVTALSGFSYNTWLDYKNQVNENTRNAAFEVLRNLGELQTVVNYAHFKADTERGDPIEGWKYVLLVSDLSHLLPKSNMQKSGQLYMAWEQNWEDLQTSAESEQRISAHITAARSDVLKTIEDLQ